MKKTNILLRLKQSTNHPLHVVGMNLLLAAFIVFGMQFIALVYAMGFSLYWTSSEVKYSRNIFLADIDNDGDLDHLAFNTDGGTGYDIDIYLNAGGNFTHVGTANESYGHDNASAGDFDGDGDIDFIYDYLNQVGLLRNAGGGTFVESTLGGTSSYDEMILTDLDNDGDLDIVGPDPYPSEVQRIYLNNSHGVFAAAVSTLPNFEDIAAADFTSDGYIDLVVTNPTTPSGTDFTILKGSGTGAFSTHYRETGISAGGYTFSEVNVADMDADGDIDVILSALDNGSAGAVYVYRNDGNGNFSTLGGITLSMDQSRALALGDLDNDGDIDVIAGGMDTAGTAAGTQVFLNDGFGGTYPENGTNPHPSTCTQGVAIGDIDADGDLDYLAANAACTGATGVVNRQYNSDQSGTSANTAPTAPAALSMTGALVPPSPKSPKTAANDNAVGTDIWNNTSNVLTENGIPATDSTSINGDITNYLKTTNYQFNIPSNATILGVKVDVKKRRSNASYTFTDEHAYVLKAGLPVSTNYADTSTNWPPSLTYVTYGGPTDMWGLTLTPSDVNASNFGFSIAAQNNGIAASAGVEIDHIRMTVYYSMRDLRLSWGSGSDTQTATRMLQYQLRVGTGSSAHNIVSGKTASPNWVTRVMPNGQSRTALLKNLYCGHTYYWAVSSVDTGFKSTASTEQSFTIDSACGLSFSGGGGGGGSTPEDPDGGGLSARYFHTNNAQDVETPNTGVITVGAFHDTDGNGIKSSRERYGFKGLPMTASGRTADDVVVRKTIVLEENGQSSFDLPPSDTRGYWIGFDTGSSVIDGYEPTNNTLSGAYVLRAGGKVEVHFGLRRSDLLSYKPCLSVGVAQKDEYKGTDAEILLQRLEDSFGQKVAKGLHMQKDLVTRKDFFTLLSRSHCIEPMRDTTTLQKIVSESARKHGLTLPLIDLPIDLNRTDSLLMYNLIAKEGSVTRATLRGDAADLSSPITRDEAMKAAISMLSVPQKKRETVGVLPADVNPADPLASDFLTLQKLGILPDSFQPILGASQGITAEEAALLLARTAFVAGKIALHAEVINVKGLKKSAPTPTFLAALPAIHLPTCLEKDADRATKISFTDILPGDLSYFDTKDLLSRGTKNSAGQTMWLVPGTRRPTEFGISQGQVTINLDEPASVLETIRQLLVLSCLPPETAIDVLSGKAYAGGREGSAESRVARDRISGLPRNASFASRILYRAQDHQKEFDLSLFTYAPEFLRSEERSPATGLSIGEASDLLASGLLMIHTKESSLSPVDAEKKFEELSVAIAKDLLGKDIDWRDESVLRTTPFTRGMLLSFLSTVVSGRTSVSPIPTAGSIPLGELWWERIDTRK